MIKKKNSSKTVTDSDYIIQNTGELFIIAMQVTQYNNLSYLANIINFDISNIGIYFIST